MSTEKLCEGSGILKSVKRATAVGMLTFATLFTHGMAHAEASDVTKKLQDAVQGMTTEQQAALLLLLNALSPASAESDTAKAAATPPSAKDALFAALKEFNTPVDGKEFNLEPFLARISENFTHPVVRDKAGVRDWLESMSSSLFDDGKPLIEFSLEDVEVEVDGNEASAYPIDIDTPIGSVTVEIMAELESDGVWRVVAIDGL
jgi:hypothetical protein